MKERDTLRTVKKPVILTLEAKKVLLNVSKQKSFSKPFIIVLEKFIFGGNSYDTWSITPRYKMKQKEPHKNICYGIAMA